MTHESGTLQPDAVRGMFDRIAPVYDAMNRVMTAGLDRSWRRLTVEAVVQPGDRVLDACCGTGDLALAAERDGGVVTGLDFSPRCSSARAASPAPSTGCEGDVLALPFADESFDAATVGFGVRNVADLELGLSELRRVLRPGGRLAILEITQPRGIAAAVLLALVRPGRAAARQRAARRQGVHVPAGERAALPGGRGARRADSSEHGFGQRPLPPPRRHDRRAPHGGGAT